MSLTRIVHFDFRYKAIFPKKDCGHVILQRGDNVSFSFPPGALMAKYVFLLFFYRRVLTPSYKRTRITEMIQQIGWVFVLQIASICSKKICGIAARLEDTRVFSGNLNSCRPNPENTI